MADDEDREDGSAQDAPDPGETREEREAHERFRRFGDSLIGNLLGDSSAAFKRGQGLVTGVAQGTKEELVRMISHEVRGFLDKMDAADLVQEIVSGLVIEMKTEIRFRRDESGRVEPDIRTSEAKVGHEDLRKNNEAAEAKSGKRQDDAGANGRRPSAKPKPGKGGQD